MNQAGLRGGSASSHVLGQALILGAQIWCGRPIAPPRWPSLRDDRTDAPVVWLEGGELG